MINGRILVSHQSITAWIQEALERDRQIKENGQPPTEYTPNGFTLIHYRIDSHCELWDFGVDDRALLIAHLRGIYNELHQFFELDKKTGT